MLHQGSLIWQTGGKLLPEVKSAPKLKKTKTLTECCNMSSCLLKGFTPNAKICADNSKCLIRWLDHYAVEKNLKTAP